MIAIQRIERTMRRFSLIVLCTAAALVHVSSVVPSSDRVLFSSLDEYKQYKEQNREGRNVASKGACRMYLAPSTIPGAGLGMFAGRAFRPGEEVTAGDGVVPLRDLAWNNRVSAFRNTMLWGAS
jgi:hypothetical protein